MARLLNTIGDMASGFVSKATDTLSAKTHTLNIKKGKEEPGAAVSLVGTHGTDTIPDGMRVIDSVDGMNAWLDSFRPGASPSGLQCLKAQMQVISSVISPNLMGMALDTLFDSLYKAISSAGDEDEKQQIREAYASMIQNFFFFSEARLYYAIDKKKDEAISMLCSAGDMLTQSVTAVASLVSPVAALKDVKVKNLFTEGEGQKKFFSAILGWMDNKKKIEEQLSNYYTALDQSFKMFDKYSELIGPSILIHGMLLKHKDRLIERYKVESYQPFDKSRSIKIKNTMEGLESISVKELQSVGGVIKIATTLVSGLSGRTISLKCDSLDSYFAHVDRLEQDLENVRDAIKDYQREKTSLIHEKSEKGLFQSSMKKDLKNRIELIESRLATTISVESKLTKVLSSLKDAFPEAIAVKKKMSEYEKELSRIAGKFEVVI